jgi:hypothetical protein
MPTETLADAVNGTVSQRQPAICHFLLSIFIDNYPIDFSGSAAGNRRCLPKRLNRELPRLGRRRYGAREESWMARVRFQCSECGFGDHEVGHLAAEDDVCIVRRPRLLSWRSLFLLGLA